MRALTGKGRCYWCKGTMNRRVGKLFCCNGCRQAAYRYRKGNEEKQLAFDLGDVSSVRSRKEVGDNGK